VVNVVDSLGGLVGLFTDGMLRRLVGEQADVLFRRVREVMNPNPVSISPDRLAADALRIMKENEFDNLPVVGEEGSCLGVVDVQDLLKAGIL
jgi:arabinose-5-phosphate isomerase